MVELLALRGVGDAQSGATMGWKGHVLVNSFRPLYGRGCRKRDNHHLRSLPLHLLADGEATEADSWRDAA